MPAGAVEAKRRFQGVAMRGEVRRIGLQALAAKELREASPIGRRRRRYDGHLGAGKPAQLACAERRACGALQQLSPGQHK